MPPPGFTAAKSQGPGTAGSFAALPFGWLIWAYGGNSALIFASIAIFAIGVWAAHMYSHMLGIHDAGEIVIDEVVGQWMCLLVVPLAGEWMDLVWLFAAFVAFRFLMCSNPGRYAGLIDAWTVALVLCSMMYWLASLR